ncbi:MAG: hypothetical protein LBS64_01085 [Spirochaetaceae bacterium]|jgi:hypothetical protein|nr:hypothetical protein [Spirochaetaceae bacterium]
MSKKLRFCILICLLLGIRLSAQTGEQPVISPAVPGFVAQTNRNIARRFLELALKSLNVGRFDEASHQAEQGLSYDGGFSGLWYVRAATEQQRGSPPGTVSAFLDAAINADNWLGCPWDAARLLYADILADTREPRRALDLLDAAPPLTGTNPAYIRAKAYYRLGTPDGRLRAEELTADILKTDAGDERFLLLYFQNNILSGFDTTPLQRAAAADYVLQVFESDTTDVGLILSAAAFAGGDRRVNLLRSFNARGLRHPLYALFALDDGLLSPREALDYFIAQTGPMPREILETFGARLAEKIAGETAAEATAPQDTATGGATVSGVQPRDNTTPGAAMDSVQNQNIANKNATDSAAAEKAAVKLEEAKQLLEDFRTFLDSFSGTITEDTDGDTIPNVTITYERGRPARIICDPNQDGFPGWDMACDYGTPRDVILQDSRILRYGDYPALASAEIPQGITVTFRRGGLAWTPVNIYLSPVLFNAPGEFHFFIPEPVPRVDPLIQRHLFAAAGTVTVALEGPAGRRVVFTQVNGQPAYGEYFHGSTLFARAEFTGGILTLRRVDTDGDGIFERLEEYRFDQTAPVLDAAESVVLYAGLFGSLAFPAGLYCAKITLDFDGDTLADFSEEHTLEGGTISRWWRGGELEQSHTLDRAGRTAESVFVYGPERRQVRVRYQDDEPVELIREGTQIPVTRAENCDFYWIGQPSPDDALALNQAVKNVKENGVFVFEGEENRIFVVRAGVYSFGELVHE